MGYSRGRNGRGNLRALIAVEGTPMPLSPFLSFVIRVSGHALVGYISESKRFRIGTDHHGFALAVVRSVGAPERIVPRVNQRKKFLFLVAYIFHVVQPAASR